MTAHRVVEKMPNNPDFPDPPYALEELTMALPEFQSALALAAGRDKHLVSIKNSKKIIVLELLEELIQYVTAIRLECASRHPFRNNGILFSAGSQSSSRRCHKSSGECEWF